MREQYRAAFTVMRHSAQQHFSSLLLSWWAQLLPIAKLSLNSALACGPPGTSLFTLSLGCHLGCSTLAPALLWAPALPRPLVYCFMRLKILISKAVNNDTLSK